MARVLLKSISKDERERAHFRSRRMFETDMESNRIIAEERGEKRAEKRAEKRREVERKETAIALKSTGIPVDAIVKAMKLTPGEIKTFLGPRSVV